MSPDIRQLQPSQMSLGKNLMLGNIEAKRRRDTEDKILGLYHLLNGYEFEQTLADSEGQGNLVCCSSWGHKESDMAVTEQQHHRPLDS